ncbi:vegetative cell wall protein gp1 [Dendrobium catenatum]|uniref:vegetative cell wall protein gp1 n=1 Tax=Dendrobium catenatum TaxID=906689 RepID=UPI0009F1FE81|nr:vegetative cell wall protein gp1 [Dendrobium catenatum]
MEVTAESPRRRSSASSSPEFEFWMLRNPPCTNPELPLLSADELFADGILVPLHILSLTPTPNPHSSPTSPPPTPPPQPPRPEDPPPSRKWKDIFKPGEKKPSKDRKPSSTASAAAEININIWPFSRSRSSGNGRPRSAPTSSARKTSSAPCSRCNSHGESSKHSTGGFGFSPVRKWSPTPARSGRIYLGRSNPVWQLRRRAVAGGRKDNGGAGVGRVLNLNVNTCIGHQRTTSCRDCDKDCEAISDDQNRRPGGGNGDAGGADGEVNGGLFKLKAIFTRKVY